MSGPTPTPETAAGGEGGKPPLLGGELPATPAATPAAAAPDTREWLPEAFRANPVFKDIANVEALAKSYDGAARLVGLDKGAVLRLPAEGDEAAMGEIFNRLGRPETPAQYEFPELPGALLEGVEPAARDGFHKLGLSAKQASGVMALYAGQVQGTEAARLARAVEVEAAVETDLKREWGDAFDDTLHAAKRAVLEMGGKELGTLLETTVMADGTRMGNHPLLIKAFAAMGKRIAEPGDLRGGGDGGGSAALTPEAARAELKALTTDREFHAARANPRHADHAKNTERWTQLNTAAAAGQSYVA